MPWLSTPRNGRGARLTSTVTFLPMISSAVKLSAIPETIVRTSIPVSTLSTINFLVLAIFSASRMVPTRISSLVKSSNSIVSFCGSAFRFSASFSTLVCSSLSSCFCICSSSILLNSNSALAIRWPGAIKSVVSERTSHCKAPSSGRFSMALSLADVCGRNGSLKTDNAVAICSATYITVLVRSSSVFTVFQGSASARYLLPRRATFINSFWLSRKR